MATWKRAAKLFTDFQVEQSDPDRFYGTMASDSVAQMQCLANLEGAHVLDVGGGPGYWADAFEAAGARYTPLDADAGELALHGRVPLPGTVMGDGQALPFRTRSFDLVYSSNVGEHVRHPWTMGDEMVRVCRPGGLVFYSYTLWYGPWGGHETAPWHYVNGRYAAQRYRREKVTSPRTSTGRPCSRCPWPRESDGPGRSRTRTWWTSFRGTCPRVFSGHPRCPWSGRSSRGTWPSY